MSPATSGLILMVFGGFLIGGVISFRKQKLPLIVQIIMGVIALAFVAYGAYVVTLA